MIAAGRPGPLLPRSQELPAARGAALPGHEAARRPPEPRAELRGRAGRRRAPAVRLRGRHLPLLHQRAQTGRWGPAAGGDTALSLSPRFSRRALVFRPRRGRTEPAPRSAQKPSAGLRRR